MDVISPTRIMAKKAKLSKVYNKKVVNKSNNSIRYNYNYNYKRIFIPYTGNRWQIPSGIKVNDRIIKKFQTLETCSQYIIMNKLKSLINGSNYFYTSLPYLVRSDESIIEKWDPPTSVSLSINNYINNDIREWKIVKSIYLRLFKLRRFLKGLIHRWLLKKCIRNVKNIEDPVTLEIPKKIVRVIDFPRRLSYVYEASTLRKTIELRITQSDYMFPNPLSPINPFTNEVFTRGQLFSIISQCKKYGEFSWILDRLYASDCQLELFAMRFRQPLKIIAIETHFSGSMNKYKDDVLDFFQVEADRDGLPDDITDMFNKRMTSRPNCTLVKEWIDLTRNLFIAKELQDNMMISQIGLKVTSALIKTYYLFN
jgi:hypothetical protein